MNLRKKCAVRGAALLVMVLSSGAWAFTADVGEIAVIEDTTGEIHASIMIPPAFCREAAKVFYLTHPDDFDSIVAFTTRNLDFLSNVYQGTPAQSDIQGIGMLPFDNTASYGSAGRLLNCVKMGKITGLPDDPDASNALTYHLTGVEILAHEYSHMWLMWLNYDKNDGLGEQDKLRGYEDGANGHWNYYANSHSVMYGSCISDLGGGQFELSGCPRSYNSLELYVMGLVGPESVEPVWFVDTGDPHGNPSIPLLDGQTAAASGVRVDVTIDDILRVNGPRVPSVDASLKRLHVAFVLVSEAGIDAPTDLITKTDTYRRRFEEWFSWSTGGLASLDTRLVADGTEEGAAEEVSEEAIEEPVEEPPAVDDPDLGDAGPADAEITPEPSDDATDGGAEIGPDNAGGCSC